MIDLFSNFVQRYNNFFECARLLLKKYKIFFNDVLCVVRSVLWMGGLLFAYYRLIPSAIYNEPLRMTKDN